MKITKEDFMANGMHIIIIASAFIIMLFGNFTFFLASLIFFLLAGWFEWIIMSKFVGKGKRKISKKDKITKQIKNSFLWVHGILHFIKKYNLSIYHPKKVGVLTGVISYFIIFLYVLVAYVLYQFVSYFAFIIYLIPIITNILFFFKNHYYIFNYPKKK